MNKLKNNYNLYAAITIICWSCGFIFTKMAMESFTPSVAGFLRYLTACAALVFIVLILKIKPPALRDLPMFLLSGGLGFFLYMIFFNKGTSMLTAATGSVIIATVPIITAVESVFFYKEKLRLYQWAGIGISFSGILVLTAITGIISLNEGVFWMLGAALILGTYNMLQKKMTRKYSSVQVASYSIFVGTAMLAIFAPQAVEQCKTATLSSFAAIGFLGVFTSAIAYICWAKAFALAERATDVGNYMFLTPFLSTLLGCLVQGEALDLPTIFGGVIILAGVLLFQWENFFHRVPFGGKGETVR